VNIFVTHLILAYYRYYTKYWYLWCDYIREQQHGGESVTTGAPHITEGSTLNRDTQETKACIAVAWWDCFLGCIRTWRQFTYISRREQWSKRCHAIIRPATVANSLNVRTCAGKNDHVTHMREPNFNLAKNVHMEQRFGVCEYPYPPSSPPSPNTPISPLKPKLVW